jgi:hypothetical protein
MRRKDNLVSAAAWQLSSRLRRITFQVVLQNCLSSSLPPDIVY